MPTDPTMDERAEVFDRIRRALEGYPERTPRPDIDPERWVAQRKLDGTDLWQSFADNLRGVRGFFMPSVADLAAYLAGQNVQVGYCDPALREAVGEPLAKTFEIRYDYTREAVDEIQFGITRAAGAIAETGSIVLKDRSTSNRLAALAPWIHVAAVAPDEIHRTIADALSALGDDPNVVWVTGPSKTADVEGILVEGVHGPGEQVCLRL